MYYVYILRSKTHPLRLYIGLTTNLEQRVPQHNRGDTQYTRAYAPWELELFVAFKTQALASQFERYLKSGSGHAFLKKHLLPQLPLNINALVYSK